MNLLILTKLTRLHHYPRYFHAVWLRYINRLELANILAYIKRSGGSVSPGVIFFEAPIVSIAEGSRIEIGENCVICSDSKNTTLGVNHPLVLRTLRPGARIVIGKDTGISGGSICAALSVKIGEHCLVGANVTITDTDFHPIDPEGRRYNENPEGIGAAPVEIEDNVFIGTGAIILKGVRIGKNSVIGAGSVVTRDVPPDSIAAGNPAKVLRNI